MGYARLSTVGWITLCAMLPENIDLRAAAQQLDLSQAVVVVSPGERGQAEKMAATILVEEVAKRTNIDLTVQENWPTTARSVIAVTTRKSQAPWSGRVPRAEGQNLPQARPEGFVVQIAPEKDNEPPCVFVVGADSRGAMFGVGRLLAHSAVT